MGMTPEAVRQLLDTVQDAEAGEALTQAGAVRQLALDGQHVNLDIALGYPVPDARRDALREQIATVLREAGLQPGTITLTTAIRTHAVQRGLQLLPQVKNLVAVSSGKGGVGKSTTAVNLALALAADGARVGVLDADIYGPSQPTLLGIQDEKPRTEDGSTMQPVVAHGLQVSSIGLLIEPDAPVVWRGPMVTQALEQLLRKTRWQQLDYLIVDMPPGTGDIQLTLAQRVPVAGAVVVTTPQDIALMDARRGAGMFQKVGVPLLGVVENMSMHVCSNCGHAEAIFGVGGGQRMAEDLGVPWLGALPLAMAIREQSDQGVPIVVARPDSPEAALYRAVARRLAGRLAVQSRDHSAKFPTIVVQDT